MSQAVDVLRVRPILLQRHGGQAERALANVDLYLSFSRAYAVRGLRAFAEAMTAAWTDESRAVEGRPDAQEESVALYTMHAAKGLEWPIVVPVNTMSRLRAPEKTVIDRETGRLYFPVFGVAPAGHEAAFENEKAELDRERIRLWYVAATRARELLILPRLDVPPAPSAWVSLVDFSLAEVPGLDLGHRPLEFSAGGAGIENTQTRERFVHEAATVTDRQRRITWLAPSRDEGTGAPALDVQPLQIFATDTDDEAEEAGETYTIQGGRERGVILHKLIEEVLTGETPETLPALVARAESLIRVLGHPVADDPAQGLTPAELAGCVIRALSLPEIADLRPRLVPEVPVYSADSAGAEERVTTGVADAIAFGPDGTPEVVIDWKSDVAPTPETLQHYRSQVRGLRGGYQGRTRVGCDDDLRDGAPGGANAVADHRTMTVPALCLRPAAYIRKRIQQISCTVPVTRFDLLHSLAPDRFIPMFFELPVPSITAKQQENSAHERPEHFREHPQYNPSY